MNIQKSKTGKAKSYQVRQVLKAIDKLSEEEMTNTKRYTYRVSWSEEDGEYLATVIEFPSLSWLHSDQAKALLGLVDLVDEVVADLEAAGESVPAPIAERRFSGKFNVRVPESRHREPVLTAAEEGVSLNRLVSDRLAQS